MRGMCLPTERQSLRDFDLARANRNRVSPKQAEQFNGPIDNQEEAARVAILEKAMKGRQPTDLMLRCKFRLSMCKLLVG